MSLIESYWGIAHQLVLTCPLISLTDTYGLISWAWQGLSQINLPTSKQLAASVQNVTRVFTGFASFDSSASFSPLDGWQRLNVKCKTITNGDLARYKRDLKHIQCHTRWKMVVESCCILILDPLKYKGGVLGHWELQYRPFCRGLLCSHSGASRKMLRPSETFGLLQGSGTLTTSFSPQKTQKWTKQLAKA